MSTAATPNILWAPNPGPQAAFLACPVREILYGGAKGGGKTAAIPAKALKHVSMYGEHSFVLILRESYPQLRELMDRARPLFLNADAVYSKSAKTWTFPSGARVQFGHTSDGYDPYWGQEYSLIVIDEVTRTIPTEQDYHMLLGSLRNSHGVPCSVVLTSNPGGPGHNWVKERFMQVPPLQVQTDERTGLQRVYIPALLSDNPMLPAEYRLQLEQMGEAERRAYLEGDWDAFEGSVFRLERGIHIWTWAEFKERTGEEAIPKHWPRFRVMDWGYQSHPFCVLWIATDENGRGYVYREWYGVKTGDSGSVVANVGIPLQPSLVGEQIATIEQKAGERINGAWTGPDMNSAGTGDTSAGIKRIEYFQRAGCHFDYWTAGPDSRKAKKMALHERLHHKPAEGDDPPQWPALIFLDGSQEPLPPGWGQLHNGAKHCIRTIPTLEYDQNRVEDIDSDGEDHPYDAVSAWCLMRPWKAKKPEPELDKHLRERREGSGTWMSR